MSLVGFLATGRVPREVSLARFHAHPGLPLCPGGSGTSYVQQHAELPNGVLAYCCHSGRLGRMFRIQNKIGNGHQLMGFSHVNLNMSNHNHHIGITGYTGHPLVSTCYQVDSAEVQTYFWLVKNTISYRCWFLKYLSWIFFPAQLWGVQR